MANRDIVTRAGNPAALNATQHDQNINALASTTETQTGTTYTVVYTDQNKVIELNNASMVCSLDAIATIAVAGDTDDFRVTLKNINAADATVQRSSTDTIDGATSFTLPQNSVVVLQTGVAAGTWSIAATSIGTLAEQAVLDGATAGTAVANKALVVDSNKDINLGTGDLTATVVTGGSVVMNGTSITATGAELNILDGDTDDGAIAIVASDRIILNDGGTMKQVDAEPVINPVYVDAAGGEPLISTTSLIITSTLTEDVWTTIGKTGAGATVTWTALDSVTAGADWIEVKIRMRATDSSGTGPAGVEMYAWDGTDGTPAFNEAALIGEASVEAAGTTDLEVKGINNAKIPINSSVIFKGGWNKASTTTSAAITLYIVGWGYNGD